MYDLDRHVRDVMDRQRAVREWAEARRLEASATGSVRRPPAGRLRNLTRTLLRALPGPAPQETA